MWLEAKVMLSMIAVIFIAITLSAVIVWNVLLGFLLIVGIGLIIFSDFIIGYQITRNHVDVLIDPNKPGYETCVLLDFSGNIDFQKVKKGPLGTREFVRYKKEADIINKGNYQIRFINGNHGFVGHEDYSENVDLYEAEALDQLEGDDIKEIVKILPMEDKQESGVL